MTIALLVVPGVLVCLSLILFASTLLEKLAPRQATLTGDHPGREAAMVDGVASVVDPDQLTERPFPLGGTAAYTERRMSGTSDWDLS